MKLEHTQNSTIQPFFPFIHFIFKIKKMDKNIQPQDKVNLNQKEHLDRRTEINPIVKEADLTEVNTNDGGLKLTNKISKNIHIKPAEEQQFENIN